jgi:hypothetical protein
MGKKQVQQNQVDQVFAKLLTQGPFKAPDSYQRECNATLAKMVVLRESEDIRDKLKVRRLADDLKTDIIRMLYGKSDPSTVPAEAIRHALAFPNQNYTVGREMRETINGPTRAIRVICLECQGNDIVGVRECAAINCPLWGFRMGNNPFYSRLTNAADADAEAVETDEEIAAMEALDNREVPMERMNADPKTPNAR